jgi:hypothetical protein
MKKKQIPIQPTSVRIPLDLLREAKHRAIDENKTVQDLVVEGLRLRLKQTRQKEEQP